MKLTFLEILPQWNTINNHKNSYFELEITFETYFLGRIKALWFNENVKWLQTVINILVSPKVNLVYNNLSFV